MAEEMPYQFCEGMKMETEKYDVVVIGTGPGGEGAAMQAVKHNLRVGVVEKYKQVGGGCTHWGTIPSKALRYQIWRYLDVHQNPLYSDMASEVEVTYPDLLSGARSVIEKQVKMRRTFYERNNVEVLHGHAAFIDEHTLAVSGTDGAMKCVEADHFVIAVGSRPARPSDIDFNHPRILDSDSVLRLGFTPQSITIYGAGVIGCEYASIMRNLGVKVNLINTRDRLLSFLDDEIVDALNYHLRDQGAVIRHNESYTSVEAEDDGVILNLRSGKRIKSDVLLWAAGRQGNSDKVGLENVGLEVNKRGHIEVNDSYQTGKPHIYAVGDVVGFPSLASASYDQGRFAATHIINGSCNSSLVTNIPVGIYTSPEISCIGKTEQELTAECVPYEVGQALFRGIARAQITGACVGMLKILFHRETLEILGVHCFGDQAAEIIHIGQAIMSQKGEANNIRYFTNTTFNYPTMAEAYRVAALNGLNRVFELNDS